MERALLVASLALVKKVLELAGLLRWLEVARPASVVESVGGVSLGLQLQFSRLPLKIAVALLPDKRRKVPFRPAIDRFLAFLCIEPVPELSVLPSLPLDLPTIEENCVLQKFPIGVDFGGGNGSFKLFEIHLNAALLAKCSKSAPVELEVAIGVDDSAQPM